MIFKESSYLAGKLLLSIDTSSSFGGFSIFKDQNLICESFWGPEKSHSETLTQEFHICLKQQNIKTKDISQVLCAYGPGSFTGLRVGLNFSKAICFANKIQLSVSPSFRAYIPNSIPQNLSPLKHIVLINGFKNQVFLCEYDFKTQHIQESISDFLLSPLEVCQKYESHTEIVAYGDGYDVYNTQFTDSFKSKYKNINKLPQNPSVVHAKLFNTHDHCLKFKKMDPLSAEPLYIKNSEAEENMNRGQLKKHTQRKT